MPLPPPHPTPPHASLGHVSALPSLSPARASICAQTPDRELPIFQGLLPPRLRRGMWVWDIRVWLEAQPQRFPKFPSFISQTKKGKPLDLGRGGGKRNRLFPPQRRGARGPQIPLAQPPFYLLLPLSTPGSPATMAPKEQKSGSPRGAERGGSGLGSLKEGDTGAFLSILDSQ